MKTWFHCAVLKKSHRCIILDTTYCPYESMQSCHKLSVVCLRFSKLDLTCWLKQMVVFHSVIWFTIIKLDLSAEHQCRDNLEFVTKWVKIKGKKWAHNRISIKCIYSRKTVTSVCVFIRYCIASDVECSIYALSI